MKYDDVSWHTGGDFPSDSPEEYGATHIALFLKWCIKRGWAGELHRQEFPKETQFLINGQMSATEFFLKCCDGKLTEDDLGAEGNAFAELYYGDDGLYLEDYADHFGDLMYVAPESAHDFNAFSAVLDARIESGVLTKSQQRSAKPWWKSW